ncbi:MAG: DUF1016 domain-containing protein, partial [Desulfamplus sp.]|nr:DUF1016 domain-containing protein [Desulfamplus sp.]
MTDLIFYGQLLSEIKSRIQKAQSKAVLAVNADMVSMYFDIGKIIAQKQQQEG